MSANVVYVFQAEDSNGIDRLVYTVLCALLLVMFVVIENLSVKGFFKVERRLSPPRSPDETM